MVRGIDFRVDHPFIVVPARAGIQDFYPQIDADERRLNLNVTAFGGGLAAQRRILICVHLRQSVDKFLILILTCRLRGNDGG